MNIDRVLRPIRRAAITLGGLLCLTVACAQDAPDREHWISTWGTAQPLAGEAPPPWVEPPPADSGTDAEALPSPIPPYPDTFNDQTVRMVVRASAGGRALRVTLSNAAGRPPVQVGAVHVALRAEGSAVVAGSDRAVTFGGRGAFTLRPGAQVVSDPVALELPALAELAVSLYLPGDTRGVTAHELGLNTTYVVPGNAVTAASMPEAATNRSYFWLSGVDVAAPARAGTIVAFGDSITDGFATTPDTHRAWPALLAAIFARNPATADWGIVNAGISGNRVLRDFVGASALARFDRDVLARAGVEWLVLFAGINDITFSALPRAPEEQRTTADRLIEGLAQIVDRAHASGIRVLGGTLMPMEGLWLYNAQTEAMRQAVNRWIRTSDRFDAIVDFDAVTRDPARPERLNPLYDSGDRIHPNDAGNAAMAAAIETALFAR
jgi:lysophospholipase L1-like esterase